jgi:hypothetical protein
MSSEPASSRIPGWFVALMVIGAAGTTAWVVQRKKSELPWLTDSSLSSASSSTATASRHPSTALADPPGSRRAPVLRAGTGAKHTNRGPCTLCHTLVGGSSREVPVIRPPHAFRGSLCVNCHRIAAVQPDAVGAAGAQQAPGTGSQPAPGQALPALALAPRRPTAGWLGMHVVALERGNDVAPNLRALAITETAAEAAAAGLRAGDVLIAINGVRMIDLQRFLDVTDRGARTGGILEILRDGTLHRVVLGQVAAPALPQAVHPPVGRTTAPAAAQPSRGEDR